MQLSSSENTEKVYLSSNLIAMVQLGQLRGSLAAEIVGYYVIGILIHYMGESLKNSARVL